ncbi:MAG: hypothetical protein M1839_001116 [Geoglossum umbratile]|nr:MAG: hypothetical protein M1839_001116 [Geoglossum umbratile]
MPGRLPTKSDFPSSVIFSITPPPDSQPPTNVLVLLHGFGDTHVPFSSLGKSLALPETACISVQGPMMLPLDLGGFHWGDDVVFDQAKGELDVDAGFERAMGLVKEDVVRRGLLEKCGYEGRDVFVFGFGQGGMVGLAMAASVQLGGVVSIGGPLPSSELTPSLASGKAKTPVLVLGGSSNTLIGASAVSKMKGVFESVEYKSWSKPHDSMPGSREEMLPIMQFFGGRLRSRRGVPEGSIEVS